MEVAHQSYASINSACEQFHTEHSEDPVFVESFEAAEEIANNVKDLHEHLDGLYKAVDALAAAQKLVAKDVRKMYKGDPTGAPAVKDFIRATRGLSVEMPSRMLPGLQKSVVGACEKWTERMAAVLTEAADKTHIASYKKFRHYKEKVGEMTVEKKSGRMSNSSSKEAYSRNQDKLSAAKGDWYKIRDKVVGAMDKEVLVGMDEANKVLLRLLQFTQAYYQQGSEACAMMNDARATLDDLVKNPPERSLKDRTVEENDEASDSASQSESSEASEEDSEEDEKPKPRKKKGKAKSGLSSSDENDDSEDSEEEQPKKKDTKKDKKKEKKVATKKAKKKAPSDAEDDSLDDYNDSPTQENAGGVSPRTLEWQRKNEQRVLMGLPPKEHPGGKSGGASDNLISDPQPVSAEDDLLGAFGDLNMAIIPAPAQQQPAATAPAPMNAFAQQQPNAFAQQPAGNVFAGSPNPQMGMMGQPMGGQQMMGGGQQMMGGGQQQMMMGGQQNMMGQPMQQSLGQQQQMYNMQQMQQQQQMQPNAFGQQHNAFR